MFNVNNVITKNETINQFNDKMILHLAHDIISLVSPNQFKQPHIFLKFATHRGI